MRGRISGEGEGRDRQHAAHEAIHGKQLRGERAFQRSAVGAEHLAHEQGLEDGPTEGEAEHIFQRELGEHGQRNERADHRANQDADAVAGDAMHGGAERLAPSGGDILLVKAGQRLPAAEHI